MPPAFVSCAAVLVRCNNTLSMLLALETKKALANLYVLGALEPTRLVQLSAKRRANGTNARKALRCYVVGAARCGKVCGAANGCCDRVHPCRLLMRALLRLLWQSSLVDGFFGRQRAEAYTPTTAPKHTAHWVEQTTVMYAHRIVCTWGCGVCACGLTREWCCCWQLHGIPCRAGGASREGCSSHMRCCAWSLLHEGRVFVV